MLLDRRSAPFLAVGAALVLLAGGLVAVGVWWATNCFGGWVGRPLGADVPAAASGPDRADLAAAGDLRDVGVDTTVRWGLWQHLDGIGESAKPVHRDPELRAATVADGQLVTAQRRPGSVEAVPPDTTLVAAYDAATGTPRWQVEGPRARGELRLLAVGGRLLLAAERLTALDVASGAFTWCVDAAGAVVAADAQRVVLATQDGRNSVLRSLDTATGAEQWRVGYEAHDATLRPVVTGGVVVAYVVPAGGGPSVLQAFDVAAGEPRWTAPSDPPGALVGNGESVLVAEVYSAARGVAALDARSGARRWATPLPGSEPMQLWPVDGGVIANAQTLTLIDAGTGAARWSAAGVDPVPAGLEPVVVGRALVVPRYRGVDTIDLATGASASAASAASASAAETAMLSISAAALVARRGERVSVLAPG